MTPDEILAMPEDRQILFIAGKDVDPIYAHKYPYFGRREMAGLYLPNPYHPPADKVQVRTWRGQQWRDVKRGPVPQKWALYPQHADGSLLWADGFKPR